MTAREDAADVVIIGAGITGAMVAAHLAEHTSASILVIDAGRRVPFADRTALQTRAVRYNEPWWGDDRVTSHEVVGRGTPAMIVGGQATHWGAQAPRFAREDFKVKSALGVGEDWPIAYDDLEPFYLEAERRIGVSGESTPLAHVPRSAPYPMEAMPLNVNLAKMQAWAAGAGVATARRALAINTAPYDGRTACQRYDTCRICPSGAKYSPDHTLFALERAGRIRLRADTLVRRLEIDDTTGRVARAHGVKTTAVDDETWVLSAKTFVLATGTLWTSHLLLLSATARAPQGLANRSGQVGRSLVGHHEVVATLELPVPLTPGIHDRPLLSAPQYLDSAQVTPSGRFDLSLRSLMFGPRPRDDEGRPVFGDRALAHWRERNRLGKVGLRAFVEGTPAAHSALTLSASRTNKWGDPLPAVDLHDSGLVGAEVPVPDSAEVPPGVGAVFARLEKAAAQVIRPRMLHRTFTHLSGGCRMGEDPATSVCTTEGRTWDHDNLYLAGAPTFVSSGATNATLTFAALSLRSAAAIARAFPSTSPPAKASQPAKPSTRSGR
jgi:choline dehydrogenase-like flavoprotein